MLDIAVWIAQGFVALFFLAAGLPKVFGRGIDRWIGFDEMPRALTVVIGLAEVSGAVALAVPMLIGRFEWLTPLAALGIAVISLQASGFHLRKYEMLPAVETALWAAAASVVAVGRWGEMSSAPAISADALVPVIAVLVPAIIAILVVLSKRPVAPANDEPQAVEPQAVEQRQLVGAA